MTDGGRDHEPLTPLEARAAQLAGVVLQLGINGHWRAAREHLMLIHDECGPDGVSYAMIGWCDTMLGRIPMNRDGRPVALIFVQRDTGQVEFNADNVPPDVRWAGQVVAARAADDEDTWNALMAALPDDGAIIGQYVWRLLEVTVHSIRGRGGWLS